MEESRYSTNFYAYLGNVRFQQTVRSNESEKKHVAAVAETIRAMEDAGWTLSEPGTLPTDPDEKIETLIGYICGTYGDQGKPCLWFYGDQEHLQFSIWTCYDDRFETLWFKPDLSRQLPVTQPPEKRHATKMDEFYHPLPQPTKVLFSRKKNSKTGEYYTNKKSGKVKWFYEGLATGEAGGVGSTIKAQTSLQDKMIEFFEDSDSMTIDQFLKACARVQEHEKELDDITAVQRAIRKRIAMMHNYLPQAQLVVAVQSIRSVLGEYYDDVADAIGAPT